MEVYFFTYILLISCSILEVYCKLTNDVKLLLYIISFALIVLQVSLRWETGTDWLPYLNHFDDISTFQSTSPIYTGMEYGYSILCWLVKLASSNYTILLLIHSILYYVLIFRGLHTFSPFFFISLLLFYGFTMGVLGSHRQLVALGIILFSCRFVIYKKFYKFLFCVIVASLFHTTAIICLCLYFLDRKMQSWFLIVLIGFAIILGKTPIPAKLFDLIGGIGGVGDKVMVYLEGGVEAAKEYGVSTIGLIKRLLFVTVFLWSRSKLIKDIPQYNFLLNAYILGILIYFMFSSSLTILVSRGSLYFNVFEPILLSCQLLLFKSAKDKLLILLILFFISIIYFVQSIAQYPELFLPYKGLFINTEVLRDLK